MIAVVDGVRAALSSILERLPKGVHLDVVMDQSVYVRRAISSLVNEAVLGAGLAAVMILVFIGDLRSTLMTASAIPLSILAAFIGVYFTGSSITTRDSRRRGVCQPRDSSNGYSRSARAARWCPLLTDYPRITDDEISPPRRSRRLPGATREAPAPSGTRRADSRA